MQYVRLMAIHIYASHIQTILDKEPDQTAEWPTGVTHQGQCITILGKLAKSGYNFPVVIANFQNYTVPIHIIRTSVATNGVNRRPRF